MKIRKILVSILSFILLFSLGGCSLFDNDNDNDNSTGGSSGGNTETTIPTTPDRSQNVIINESTIDHVPSTIEETVSLVYDSVVVINAESRSGISAGSGVMIGVSDTHTYIITCHHVIEGATNITVTLSDDTKYGASIIGGDKTSDIAVIAIEKTGLTLSKFIDDSNKVTLASTVIAIGNPLGTLGGTVTVGIVSSTNRLIEMSDGTSKDLIQFDAAINSGNSGGGLFNAEGQLIGIVNAKYSAAGVEGLGFAIPANTALSIAKGLIEKGYVEGRYNLGVTFADGYYKTGGFFGTTYKVVYVSEIDPNGSCYGKLKLEDILVGISIKFKDTNKQDKVLDNFSVAQDVINFINDVELSIGDVIIYTVRRGTISSPNINVEVEVVQYIYDN
ncbi:MAG: trypsin-like peptidase domain-containing protein [Bacilli bacterium]|nr:trypsin-like peptidase domain-containing protein [Bacilli bacterium]